MGEYIYRISGKNKFTLVEIDGVIQRVYHLVYWWKPGFRGITDPYKPKNHAALYTRLESSLKGTPIDFVTTCEFGKPIDHVYEPTIRLMSYSDCNFGTDRMPTVSADRLTGGLP